MPHSSFGTNDSRAKTRVINWILQDGDKWVKNKDLSEFKEQKATMCMKFPVWFKEEYDLPREKLPLIIFGHGLSGTASPYMGLYREFASHGYLVIALDFHCGSCSYTENEKGEPILFDA